MIKISLVKAGFDDMMDSWGDVEVNIEFNKAIFDVPSRVKTIILTESDLESLLHIVKIGKD